MFGVGKPRADHILFLITHKQMYLDTEQILSGINGSETTLT